METVQTVIANISHLHLNLLLILGIALFGGTIGGRLFQKFRIPQVVGYILIGFLLGPGMLQLIDAQMILALQPFSYFALGLIGFMIGGELNHETLRKYGRQLITILLFEGLVSFFLVTLFVGMVGSFFFSDARTVWSLALLLGAIASATAPAATTDVLWEYKAKGPLTTMVFGIVALDDVLAIVLFSLASSCVTHFSGAGHGAGLAVIWHPAYEIGGALVTGGVSGMILITIIRRYQQKERMLVFLIGMVLFVLGFSAAVGVSMLLAAMVLGMVVTNGLPSMSKQVFNIIQDFSPPIFILFFVLVGTKLNPQAMSPVMIVLVFLYLIGRTAGKMLGAYWGARVSGAEDVVRRYLPLCLFSQAGVAIGLSLVAAQSLNETMGNMIIVIITMTTFVVQLIGPPCVRRAVIKSGEAGKNVTEDDIVRAAFVRDVMDRDYPVIHENTPVKAILEIFARSPYTQYPVVDSRGILCGVVNIDGIKNSLLFERSDQLLLAADLKEPFAHVIKADAALFEAKNYMDNFRLGFLPVADSGGAIIGGFDRRLYKRFVSTRLLEGI